MTETIAEQAVSAAPEYPMERETSCPFAPPRQMLEMADVASHQSGRYPFRPSFLLAATTACHLAC